MYEKVATQPHWGIKPSLNTEFNEHYQNYGQTSESFAGAKSCSFYQKFSIGLQNLLSFRENQANNPLWNPYKQRQQYNCTSSSMVHIGSNS